LIAAASHIIYQKYRGHYQNFHRLLLRGLNQRFRSKIIRIEVWAFQQRKTSLVDLSGIGADSCTCEKRVYKGNIHGFLWDLFK
jgi:hypothetical protein